MKIWYRNAEIGASDGIIVLQEFMTYSLVIFDFDGTLADTMPFMLGLADELADKHHLPRLDKNNIQLLKGLNAANFMKLHNIPLWKVPILAAEIQSMMYENISQVRLFEGIEELLRELSRQGVQIAVVSSNALKNVKEVLGEELTGLISFFECGVSMFGKAEKLSRVIKFSGKPASQALSIGDEIRDIEAARKAGIPCAAVSWGFSSRTALESLRPDHLFDVVEQLNQVI